MKAVDPIIILMERATPAAGAAHEIKLTMKAYLLGRLHVPLLPTID